MKCRRVLFLVRRVGPYHHARYEESGRVLDLTVVQTRPDSREYPWTTTADARGYHLTSLGQPAEAEIGLRGQELAAALAHCFEQTRPDAVACAGWADPEYHAALRLCRRLGIPAVVMSDSTFADEPRQWWKEIIKGSLIRQYAAAVVAGSRSRDYLRRLGFPAPAIFTAWDVVDNAHFARVAALSPGQRELARGRLKLPSRYFLCVARFIPKKNLERLIDAYAQYVAAAGAGAWSLVLSGAGPLEEPLHASVAAAGLTGQVFFPGFLQYDDLPACYALAGALVLPSISDQWGLVVNEAMAAGLPVLVSQRCGCAPELVEEGRNGFTFDPEDTGALATKLASMAGMDQAALAAFGQRSREIVTAYSPASFAAGLEAAIVCAMHPRSAPSLVSRLLVNLLATRAGSKA